MLLCGGRCHRQHIEQTVGAAPHDARILEAPKVLRDAATSGRPLQSCRDRGAAGARETSSRPARTSLWSSDRDRSTATRRGLRRTLNRENVVHREVTPSSVAALCAAAAAGFKNARAIAAYSASSRTAAARSCSASARSGVGGLTRREVADHAQDLQESLAALRQRAPIQPQAANRHARSQRLPSS